MTKRLVPQYEYSMPYYSFPDNQDCYEARRFAGFVTRRQHLAAQRAFLREWGLRALSKDANKRAFLPNEETLCGIPMSKLTYDDIPW